MIGLVCFGMAMCTAGRLSAQEDFQSREALSAAIERGAATAPESRGTTPYVAHTNLYVKVIYGALSVCDLATTYAGLNDGATELNPVAAAGGSPTGVVAIVAVLRSALGWWLNKINHPAGWWTANVLSAGVCGWNLSQ